MNYHYFPTDHHGLKEAYLDAMREVLAPQYRRLNDEQVAGIIRSALDGMTPQEQEAFSILSLQNTYDNFLSRAVSSVGRFARSAGRQVGRALPGIVRTVAPIAQMAAPIVGTMIGGPAGAMAGNLVGNLIGNLSGGQAPSGAPQVPPQAAQTPLAGGGMGQPTQANPVVNQGASQLLGFLQDPQVMQAILGQVLGRFGNGVATLRNAGGESFNIPYAALMDALSVLAERAAEESIRSGGFESEAYLLNSEGYYRIADPSDRVQRADAIFGLLRENYAFHQTEAEEMEEGHPYDEVTEWLLEAGLIR